MAVFVMKQVAPLPYSVAVTHPGASFTGQVVLYQTPRDGHNGPVRGVEETTVFGCVASGEFSPVDDKSAIYSRV